MEVTDQNVGFYNHAFEDVLFSMLLICWNGYMIKVLLMLISSYWMTYGLDLFVLENSSWTGLVLILS